MTELVYNPLFIAFASTAFLQLVILFTFLISLSRQDNRKHTFSPVSVIVASKNHGSKLPELINKLLSQDHPQFELIIVNDRSSDETEDFLREIKMTDSRITVVTVEHKPENMDGKKYAITLGIKAAKQENIILTDADCLPESNQWLSKMSSAFNEKGVEIVLGVSLYKKSKGILGSFVQFESLWTAIQYICLARLGMPYMGVGRNLGYKKDLFLKNKGFTGIMNITGGDDDLFVNKHANSNNTSVIIGKDALVWSEPKTSWSDFIIQKKRHLSVGKKYKLGHKFILGIVSLSQFVFWLALIALLIINTLNVIVTSIAVARTLLQYLTFSSASKRFGVPFTLWGLLFLDFIFLFYYLSTGLRAIFTKKVRWS